MALKSINDGFFILIIKFDTEERRDSFLECCSSSNVISTDEVTVLEPMSELMASSRLIARVSRYSVIAMVDDNSGTPWSDRRYWLELLGPMNQTHPYLDYLSVWNDELDLVAIVKEYTKGSRSSFCDAVGIPISSCESDNDN